VFAIDQEMEYPCDLVGADGLNQILMKKVELEFQTIAKPIWPLSVWPIIKATKFGTHIQKGDYVVVISSVSSAFQGDLQKLGNEVALHLSASDQATNSQTKQNLIAI
jgi:hypothetical protein